MAATITQPAPPAAVPPPCPEHHGRYTAGCPHCRARSNWYNKRLRAHRRDGRWQPMVPTTQIRAHIAELRAAGMVLNDIARAAGISNGYLNSIIYDLGRHKVNPTVGAILLGLKPKPSKRFLLDPTGTRRRLQALQAAGWTRQAIAEHIGVHETLPGKWLESATVTRTTVARVKKVYDDLSDQPGPSSIAAQRAQARGWVDSYHWTDDTIDDPNAQPTVAEPDPALIDDVLVQRAMHGDQAAAAQLTAAERRAAVDRLTAADVSTKAIGERLRLAPRNVTRHRTAIREATAANQAAA